MKLFIRCSISVCCLLFLSAVSLVSVAHESRPLYMSIAEQTGNVVVARLNSPSTVQRNNRPLLLLPPGCEGIHAIGSLSASSTWVAPVHFYCEGGINGKALNIRYPIANPAVTTLIHMVRQDGSETIATLLPDQSSWTVPETPGVFDVAIGYLQLGWKHIWEGIDHLLFVAGLVLLCGWHWRRLLLAITGFTIAHSITLALAALKLVTVPVPPTEAAIALSIVFLARELATQDPDSLAKRFPFAVACLFGLLHGFGFAAVLSETGLPQNQIATGLLFFNIGVELGQIAFVAILVGVGIVIRLASRNLNTLLRFPSLNGERQQIISAYGLGIMASYWLIERTVAFL
jgi:hypothetical protein